MSAAEPEPAATLHQRAGLVLGGHHYGHSAHAGDVGGGDVGGHQGWSRDLGTGLIRSVQGAAVDAGGPWGAAGKAGAGVVARQALQRVGLSPRAWPVPHGAARGGDDGGGVGGRVVGVEVVPWVGVGDDGRQGAVFGDDVRARAALGPRHAFGSLSVLLDVIGHVVLTVLLSLENEDEDEEEGQKPQH